MEISAETLEIINLIYKSYRCTLYCKENTQKYPELYKLNLFKDAGQKFSKLLNGNFTYPIHLSYKDIFKKQIEQWDQKGFYFDYYFDFNINQFIIHCYGVDYLEDNRYESFDIEIPIKEVPQSYITGMYEKIKELTLVIAEHVAIEKLKKSLAIEDLKQFGAI